MNVIDRSKNVCYVITVPYVEEARTCTYKYQKFISLHSAFSKKFEAFRNRYFQEVLQIPIEQIGEWDKSECTEASQYTVSWKQWKQDATIRAKVLEGITEREKCR